MIRALTDGILNDYRTRPIGEAVAQAEARKPGYRKHPVRLDVAERNDPLVKIAELGIAGENHYAKPFNPPYYQPIPGAIPNLWLRASLAEKLKEINAVLAPYGLELWVFDAWRPIAVQNYFHDVWMPTVLKTEYPDLEPDALQAEVEKYWAKGAPGGRIDPYSPPPHSTGAAIDLTIREKNGAALFMGSIFDDVTSLSNTAQFETTRGLCFSHQEARNNRRMLYWLMHTAGFANNPSEWWHFSCGDQMWARLTGAEYAYYSATEP